ncbi:MAG: 23S rRNA pseudouridine1911/1915/1917 synthase [Gammaproteobacteria bacterium]|jgi:23S rRNA pseudouridine1911/1915/1917 synthase
MDSQQNPLHSLHASVPPSLAGERLDRALGQMFSDFSRARLQRWVREGRVQVDGTICTKTRARVDGGEQIQVNAVPEVDVDAKAQPIELQLLYRDEHLLVLDKPAGLVVHPGAGNPDGTLLNALLHLDSSLATLPRAGLVHRLDKLTTGLMVVACTLQAQTHLTRMIAAREVHRQYEAIVHGIARVNGTVDAPIGRHRVHRTRMAVRDGARAARTDYQRIRTFAAHSHLRLQLHSGRTHQIRVHLAHIGLPIVGDRDYGGVRPAPARVGADVAQATIGFARQALHACKLEFEHPISAEHMIVSSPLPADMVGLLDTLKIAGS